MSKKYRQRPSNIIGLSDGSYSAYCFDEACIFLINAIEEKKELHFEGDEKEKPVIKHYSSISEFYESLGVKVNGL